jgi:carboxylesterase type B
MKSSSIALLLLTRYAVASPVPAVPIATDVYGQGVTYRGIYKNSIEAFIGIRYAHDTGGENRFKPPVPYTPASGSTIEAKDPGPSCPQRKSPPHYGIWSTYDYITETSEDCLRLNVWRPNGTKAGDKLPVLVYIHGGASISILSTNSERSHTVSDGWQAPS